MMFTTVFLRYVINFWILTDVDAAIDKKFELMLTRRTKAYSSFGSVV